MDVFTNREIAVAIWLFLFMAWAFQKVEVRLSFYNVVKSLFQWRIITLILLMFLYITSMISLSTYGGFWNNSLIKDTVYWTFGAAFIMLIQVNKKSDHDNYFSNIVRDNLKVILLLEFILNFQSFSLLAELIITPIIITLVMVKAYADVYINERPQYRPVISLLNNIFLVYIIGLFIASVFNVISNFQSFASQSTLRSFLLPPLFSILYMPFLYLAALFMKYEVLFIRIDIINKNQKLAKDIKIKTLQLCHINLSRLNAWSQQINHIGSKKDLLEVISNFNQKKQP